MNIRNIILLWIFVSSIACFVGFMAAADMNDSRYAKFALICLGVDMVLATYLVGWLI